MAAPLRAWLVKGGWWVFYHKLYVFCWGNLNATLPYLHKSNIFLLGLIYVRAHFQRITAFYSVSLLFI